MSATTHQPEPQDYAPIDKIPEHMTWAELGKILISDAPQNEPNVQAVVQQTNQELASRLGDYVPEKETLLGAFLA